MPSLKLTLLGSPHAAHADGSAVAFRLRKELAVLAYLAVEGADAQPRARLLGLLWPEASEASARNNLRVVLANLRHALGSAAPSADRQVVQLDLDSGALDVATFQELLSSTHAHHHQLTESCAECAARLEQALELYRGEFLAGFTLADAAAFEEWALTWREALHQQVLDALTMLANYCEQVADYAALCRHARRQLELEPWHEPAQRQLMRGLALAGDRDAALSQYDSCRQVLADELGVEPDVETRALYEQIRAGHFTPATRDAAAARHNLPTPLTPFVGREAELATIAALQQRPDTRLLTLVGAGGMGKTRLALELARASLDAYADGVFFVSLASLATASELPATIARALDLSLHGGDPATALLHFLRTKHLLLILDNFEHLLEGAEWVVALLQEAPRLQIVATSRAQLNLRGEQLYVVQGLEYGSAAPLTAVPASAAVRLFAQAARRAQPSFQVTEPNLPEVLRICRLVHGMPLGLELAAAWTEMLSLREIAQEVERSADFLAADWTDMPERQRSMRAVFDWSWQLLTDAERRVFRQLSVFRGGFTRAAAERVAGASLRVLTNLVHKSLLSGSETKDAVSRYQIHELLREFAAEQLDAAPEERAAVAAGHSSYFLQFVAERERRLARNEPREAAEELQSEIDNVRQAWAWAAAHARTGELERSAYGLWLFYSLTGLLSEGEQAFSLAATGIRATVPQAIPDQPAEGRNSRCALSKLLALRASSLFAQSRYDEVLRPAQEAVELGQVSNGMEGETLGRLVWGQTLNRKSRYRDARPHLEQAVHLARRYQDDAQPAESLYECENLALIYLGASSLMLGDYAAARDSMTQALELCQRLNKLRGQMVCLYNFADIARDVVDYALAQQSYKEGLQIARALHNPWGEGTAELELGDIAHRQGHYSLARELLKHALEHFQEIGDNFKCALALMRLGLLDSFLGDYSHAREQLDHYLQFIRVVDSPELEVDGLCALAVFALQTGDSEQALTYAEEGARIAQQIGSPFSVADALLLVGHAQSALHRQVEAATAYQQALELNDQLGRTPIAAEAQAGLAQVALARDDTAQARAHVEAIVSTLADTPRAGLFEPFSIYLASYRVLDATDDPRAAALLQTAQRLLYEYADTIADETLRRSFLENVATHREILDAAGTAHT